MLQLTLLEREEVELEFTTYSIVEQLSRVISTQENQAILKDIEIQFEKPRKDIMVYGDEQRLEQVGSILFQMQSNILVKVVLLQ